MRRAGLMGFGACAIAIALLRCGARTPLLVPDREDAERLDASDGEVRRDGSKPDAFVELCPDAGPMIDAGCTGIACNIPACGASAHTTLSGRVFDPGGKRPIYNALVYVPNKPLEPIKAGPVCATCQAAASGSPIVKAVTDAEGRFTLTDPPAGANVPIVMQVGKWRRMVTTNIAPCVDNVATDPDKFRLPRRGSEGDMPKIAFATGCDMAQCFFTQAVGLDPAEITGPSGDGHIHVYTSPHETPSFITQSPGDPYDLWGDLERMRAYDILFNACECTPHARTTDPKKPAYANMKAYLDGGGRMFGTHYHWNWFSQPDGPKDFQEQAPWLSIPTMGGTSPFFIDSSHPRGKAFADWLFAAGVSSKVGSIDLVDTRSSVEGLNGGKPGHGKYTNTTQWIYHPANFTLYLSFNTPSSTSTQCGRAVFSDVHLSGAFNASPTNPFPKYCVEGDHRANEVALEFLFFDIASCVQDDTKPPTQPCEK